MSLPVANKPGFLSKSLTTDIADVRSLASVNQYVLFLSSFSGEGFTADWTRERPNTLMDPQVKIQIPLLAKSLSTRRTDDFLFPLVPDQMLIEILLGGQAAFAYLTFESWLMVSILHVRFDSGHILAGMSANATNDGRFAAVHLIHVLLQIVLDLELFFANRARVLKAAGMLSCEVILQRALVVALVVAYATRI